MCWSLIVVHVIVDSNSPLRLIKSHKTGRDQVHVRFRGTCHLQGAKLASSHNLTGTRKHGRYRNPLISLQFDLPNVLCPKSPVIKKHLQTPRHIKSIHYMKLKLPPGPKGRDWEDKFQDQNSCLGTDIQITEFLMPPKSNYLIYILKTH